MIDQLILNKLKSLKATVVERSDISNILELSEPERTGSSTY